MNRCRNIRYPGPATSVARCRIRDCDTAASGSEGEQFDISPLDECLPIARIDLSDKVNTCDEFIAGPSHGRDRG